VTAKPRSEGKSFLQCIQEDGGKLCLGFLSKVSMRKIFVIMTVTGTNFVLLIGKMASSVQTDV
jgi:hypothetical protein